MAEQFSTLTGAVFLQNTTPDPTPIYTLPALNSVEPGRLLTLLDTGSNAELYPWTISNPGGDQHIINTNGGWVTFVAGPDSWLRLGASDLYQIQDFTIQQLQATQISTTVYATVASFSSFNQTTLPSSANVFTPLGGSISTLNQSSITFTTDSQANNLYLSSGQLLYNGNNYSQSIPTEIVQTFTF